MWAVPVSQAQLGTSAWRSGWRSSSSLAVWCVATTPPGRTGSGGSWYCWVLVSGSGMTVSTTCCRCTPRLAARNSHCFRNWFFSRRGGGFFRICSYHGCVIRRACFCWTFCEVRSGMSDVKVLTYRSRLDINDSSFRRFATGQMIYKDSSRILCCRG